MPRVRVIKVPADQATDKTELQATEVAAQDPVSKESAKEDSPAKSNIEKAPVTKVHQASSGIVVTRKTLIFTGLSIVVLLFIILAIANRQPIDSPGATSGQKAAQSDANKYQEELSKIVDLPQGKTPTFSTVDDAQKLAAKSPTLFKNAQNGDAFLVYLNDDKSGKVVLYRPSTKKVILFIDGVDLGQQGTSTGTPN